MAALEAGVRDFGENYAEEAVDKINATGPISGLTWHMIGHIQSRKADLVAQKFDYVHSIDSLKLALRLERFAAECNRKLPILLECNVGGEESKFGYPAADKTQWAALLADTNQIALLPHLEIRGLMTMPPLYDDAEKTRPFFQRLRELRDYLAEHNPQVSWSELSMGTSTDFAAAVQEGATLVRVGTAILGSRPARL
jgi:pyridoxal phosphate enzyme (YggS family)